MTPEEKRSYLASCGYGLRFSDPTEQEKADEKLWTAIEASPAFERYVNREKYEAERKAKVLEEERIEREKRESRENLPIVRDDLCLACRHCSVMNGEHDLSDVTPGYPMSFRCDKGWWELDQYSISKGVVIKCLEEGFKCLDFET